MTSWTRPDRIARLHGATIGCLAALSVLSAGVCRLEQLMPDAHWLSPDAFGQFLSLHRVLLASFVLLPVIPSVFGYSLLPAALDRRDVAWPGLALGSWVCLLIGSLLVLQSFLFGEIEPGWAYAVVSPITHDLVSLTFLAGLFLAHVSALLTAVVIVATIHQSRMVRNPIFCRAMYAAGWLTVVASGITLGALMMASVEKQFTLMLFDPGAGGDPALLAQLSLWAATPMQAATLLSVIGLAGVVLRVEAGLSALALRVARWQLAGVALLSLPSLDTRALPNAFAANQLVLAFLVKALFVAALISIVVTLFRAAARQRAWNEPGRIAVGVALLLILLAAPLDLALSAPGSSIATGYVGQGTYYLLLAGPALLSILGSGFHLLGGRTSREPSGMPAVVATAVIVLGLITTTLPMVVMGASGLRMEMTSYPAEFVPLQTLVFFGGGILSVGLLLAAIDLVRRARVAPWPSLRGPSLRSGVAHTPRS